MTERFSFEFDDDQYGKPIFYDNDKKLSFEDVCNLLNDNSKEIDRLLEVINNLHTDIRNLGLNKRKQEEIIRIQYEIIESYKELFDVTNGKWYIKEQ